MKVCKWLSVMLVFVGLTAGVAQAAPIYSDDFSGSSTVSLDGTTPDITFDGNTWIARTGTATWMADGSIAAPSVNQNENALLPFAPESGKIYTLSVSMDVVGDDATWMAMGFVGNQNLNGSFTTTYPNSSPWMYLNATGAKVGTYLGPAAGSVDNLYPGDGEDWSEATLLTIVLDTTATDWSVEWLVNGVSKRTATFSGGNPDIQYVGIARQTMATGTVESFELSVVPEPVSVSLLAIGGVSMMLLRHGIVR